MADFLNFVIPSVVFVALALLALWAIGARRADARLSAAETRARELAARLDEQLGVDDAVAIRVGRLESFMRPDTGEIAPRLAQLERQQAVDSRAFAHQARLHNQRIVALDERLQYMAREMRSERPTPLRPPAP